MINDFQNSTLTGLTISQSQLENTKIFTNRWDWVKTLTPGIRVLEIGVAAGDYSEHILSLLNPEYIYLVDTFAQRDPELARPGLTPRFFEGEGLDFVKNRLSKYSQVVCMQGRSQDVLPKIIEQNKSLDNKIKFDMIYIDASHKYEDFCQDLINSITLLSDDGIIAINDYVDSDSNGVPYGVVDGTNRFLHANKDWEVIGISLDTKMYLDLIIKRSKNN
jgi:hypothetical protein